MGTPSTLRTRGRQLVRQLPAPVERLAIATVRRARGLGRPRRAAEGYPTSFPSGHHPAVEGPWPEPPRITSPGAAARQHEVERPTSFDLALFEALNAEYAAKPLVTSAPKYDHDSVVERSRWRLAGIHERLGLAGRTVLEIGCGTGYEVWFLANHFGADAWGIDISPRQGWPELRGDRVHLIEGDIAGEHGLPLDHFDRAISFTVWEHITRPEAALEQLFRVLKPGGMAWVRANLYRGPTASHLYRHITFPFPHLLFQDDVIAAAMERMGGPAEGAAWVNRLTWEQYEATMLAVGFRIRALKFDLYPLDEAFHARFEDVLGRYPRRDLERGFFTVVLEKPR